MAKRSRRWATLEQATADALGGERVTTPWYLFKERPDVVATLPAGGRLVCDCKAYARFSHHTLLESVQSKYCQPGDTPALVTKHRGQRGAYVTIRIETLASLLNELRQSRETKRSNAHENPERISIPRRIQAVGNDSPTA